MLSPAKAIDSVSILRADFIAKDWLFSSIAVSTSEDIRNTRSAPMVLVLFETIACLIWPENPVSENTVATASTIARNIMVNSPRRSS